MVTSEIGEIIRSARIAQGLRLEDLSAASSVSISFLSDLENGKPTLQIGKVLHILDELGVQIHLTPPSPQPESPTRKRYRP